MSGHSKWAGIKHKKAVVDQRRGKLFGKMLRAVEVAARQGGGNPEANPTLADAMARARDASVPGDNIERAIKRGTGDLEGVTYESLTYEGYAPGGVAVLIDAVTDSRNRAAADIRRILTRAGGVMGEPGSVAWMFTKTGVVLIEREGVDEDSLLAAALEAGAQDVSDDGEFWEVTCVPQDLGALRKALEAGGFRIESAQVSMVPSTTVRLEGEEAMQVLRLIDELDELDDVQAVHSNFDVPDEVMAQLAG